MVKKMYVSVFNYMENVSHISSCCKILAVFMEDQVE